jgi:sigma-B regulation protein RsbU (phosphoserine phosphatase)
MATQPFIDEANICLEDSITLPNDISTIPQLNEFVDVVCESVNLEMAETMSLNLALEEAVVNVMDYAYPNGGQGDVTIKAKSDKKNLVFVIIDSGIPFDPTQKEEVDTTLSAEERSIGGLGIHLVRNIMDNVSYERIDDKNVLTLVKKIC